MKKGSFPKLEKCALCFSKKPLQKSHIIPKFIGRIIKGKSQTLINGLNPQKNPKPQDITKEYLLCRECEKKLSVWENLFRKNLISTKEKKINLPVAYESWMLKFAVSISWRVLIYLKHSNPPLETDITSKELKKFIPSLNSDFHSEANKALEKWRLFLLSEKEEIAPYNQHFLILNGENFPNESFNNILFTIYQDEENAYTHAQLGQFIILGIIKQSVPEDWIGTTINIKNGVFGSKQTIPTLYAQWLDSFFNEVENCVQEQDL